MSEGLYEKLKDYGNSEAYAFHMPGHKRNTAFPGALDYYGIDITEIRDFDDLHHADGILLKTEQLAARLFHAEESHLLVNGSTVGILSAILGSTRKGDKILVSRNCHKSVYNAIYMNELDPVYLYPEYDANTQLNGPVSPARVRMLLKEHPDIKAVVIVSPTYDGVLSDVKTIAEIVHERGIPLIVDEAHGAHFGFHPYFPENACQLGADLVIHSLHKTLPSPTQTALIHLNGSYADRERVRMYLHMLQSSSPSYVLMAGIDRCMRILRDRGKQIFQDYVSLLTSFRESLGGLKHIRIPETEEFDRSKILISVAGTSLSSKELVRILWEKYHLEFEMTAGSYVLAMTSVCDTEEGFLRLKDALFEIDLELSDASSDLSLFRLPQAEAMLTLQKAVEGKKYSMEICWKEAIGYISTEFAYIYPPGIPVIVPGEIVSREAVDVLQWYQKYGFQVEGPAFEERLRVLDAKTFKNDPL